MARISLRAYITDIESLINKGRYEEAIVHCRHILQTYPKSVQTYRLLGKAFLEARRYTDAIDIFQRLLSAVPDDFVAHLGLSIIREDEGTLDAAIWHMERAFEIQPYNGAIQEELRRLYLSRDGSAPPRMRLTRGALARMYARGQLHQQAIAEVRNSLAKDPQRIDLQALLAGMYRQAGKNVEAAEAASKVIRKLPFCLEANKVLALVLADSNKHDEAQAYQARVIALDPYYAYMTPEMGSIDMIPEGSVALDKLEVSPDQFAMTEKTSDWMSSLGLAIPEEESLFDEELPEWLISASEAIGIIEEETPSETEEHAAAPFTGSDDLEAELDNLDWVGTDATTEALDLEQPGVTAEQAEDLPDWLSDASWEAGEALEEGQETTPPIVELLPSAETDEDEALAEGDIPDWLTSLAPADEVEDKTEHEEDLALAALLGAEQPGEIAEEAISAELEAETEEEPAALADVQTGEPAPEDDWLSEFEAQITQRPGLVSAESAEPAPESEVEEGELPDWLTEIETQAEGETPTAEIEAEAEEAELPEWLADLEVEAEGETPTAEIEAEAEEAELPEWLADLEVETEGETPTAEIAAEAEEAELPEWLAELEVEAESETPTAEIEADAEEAELPEWLADLEVEAEGETPTAEIEAEGEEAELPEWLADLEVEAESETSAAEAEAEGEEAELPEWLAELEVEAEGETPTAEIEAEAEEAELPEWLADLEVEEESETPTAEIEADAEEAELPEWLVDLEVEAEGETPTAEIEAEAEEAELPEWLADVDQDEQVPAVTPAAPHAAIPATPEWLREFVDETPAEQPAAELESPPDFADADEALAWLAGLAATTAAETPESKAGAAIEPDVEAEIAATHAELEQAPEVEMPQAPAPELEGAAAEAEETDVPELDEPQAEAPQKLKLLPGTDELAKTAVWDAPPEPEEGVELESPPDFADMDAAIAWLEGLAAKQGAQEDELFSAPDERRETAPDWVQKMIDQEPPGSQFPPAEAEPPADEASEPAELATAFLDQIDSDDVDLEESVPAPAQRLDLNSASLVELERLPGVGFRLAQSILSYRAQHGGFQQLEDLLNFSELSDADLPELAQYLEVSTSPAPAPAEPEAAPVEPAAPPSGEDKTALQEARQALASGELHAAIYQYQALIRERRLLADVIFDLNQALHDQPESFELWQTLGDAYLRDDQAQEAMDAYQRAEDLLY